MNVGIKINLIDAQFKLLLTRNEEMMYKLIKCKFVHVHGTSRILWQHEYMNVDSSSGLSQQIIMYLPNPNVKLMWIKTDRKTVAGKPDKTYHVIFRVL